MLEGDTTVFYSDDSKTSVVVIARWNAEQALPGCGDGVPRCRIFDTHDLSIRYWSQSSAGCWLVHCKVCEVRSAAAVAKGVIRKEGIADSLECAELKDHAEWAAKHLPC